MGTHWADIPTDSDYSVEVLIGSYGLRYRFVNQHAVVAVLFYSVKAFV